MHTCKPSPCTVHAESLTMVTPPNSNNTPVPFGTPVHTRSSTTGYLGSKYLSRDQIFRVMSQEMAPFFLGPMPPQEFLSTFLSSTQPRASSFKADMFDTLADVRSETAMYQAFVSNWTSQSILGTEKGPLDRYRSTSPQDNLYSRNITLARQGPH